MSVTLNASTSSGFVSTADTSGTVEIQSNGTTKLTVASTGVTATSISGTIIQGTAVASTSGTSIDFTGIPSWAKRVIVMFSGVSTSGTSNLLVQLGDAGGIEATGYVSNAGSRVSETSSTIGYIVTHANASAETNLGNVVICLVSGNTWVSSAVLARSAGALNYSGGNKTLSDTLDRVRVTTVNGTDTFDAGTINIQYEG